MKLYKYSKLAQELSVGIEQGLWQVHEKLPSIRTLAEQYQLSNISVQHALQLLESRGILFAKPKSGYFVAPRLSIEFSEQPKSKIDKPKPVNVPDVFFDIMERSAAFDIAPKARIDVGKSTHLQSLNRHISRAMRQHQQSNALYYDAPAGDNFLREQIAQRYQRRGVSVSASDVCITLGCQNGLYLALQQVCNAGDTVAVESPAFYGVIQLLQHLKLNIVEIPASYTRGMSAQALSQVASQWPVKACVVTPNYATPTGACMTDTQMQEILKVAAKYNITLIEDDIYGDLGFHRINAPLKKFDENEQVILCSSLSKSLSRDLRLGWTISKLHGKAITKAKLVNHLSGSFAIQQGLASFIHEGHYERHLQYYRRQLLEQREQLLGAIKQYWQFDIRYTVPEGGLSLWLQLPDKISTLDLYNQALERDIVITPGRLFSSESKFNANMRMTFAHPAVNQRLEAIKGLGSMISVQL